MKTLLFTAFIVFASNGFGQVWGNQGATWHYDFGLISGGLYTITYEMDTVIQGQTAQKLSVLRQDITTQSNGTTALINEVTHNEFTRYSGDSVFWYSNNQFHLLYDFGALPGDSWVVDVAPTSSMLCALSSKVEVVDTGHVQINGMNLRYIDLRYVQGGLGVSGRAIERIGMVEPFNPEMSFLFPTEHNCDPNLVVDFWLYNFRCYTDDNFATYNVNSQSCDYPAATVSIATLENDEKEIDKMYDLLGREVKNPKGMMVIVVYTDGTSEKMLVTD